MQASDYIRNRQLLAAAMAPGSLAIVNSNDVMPTNADGTMRFRQNNDLYWLTGLLQDETTLLLFPEHPDPALREILFIKKADADFVKWNGRLHSLEEAAELTGIRNVQWQSAFDSLFYSTAVYAETIYLNAIEHPRAENKVQTRDDRFAVHCHQQFPLHQYKRLAPLMGRLRLVKSEAEIDLLKKACFATGEGFKRILRFVKPGIKEKWVEAELIHEYMQHDTDWSGYEPIVASGPDSCILHYTSNHKICCDGDLLLLDAAASYQLYNADMTRTIPVNGRFNKRQRQVYEAVLRVHKALQQFAKPGMYWQDIENHNRALIIEELVGLGLASTEEAKSNPAGLLNRYSYHSFGHFIGLDVHDAGNRYEKLPENSVLTIEPGIYIQEENIGIRLENNVVLTSDGTIDLMDGIPLEAEEIEELMNQ